VYLSEIFGKAMLLISFPFLTAEGVMKQSKSVA